MLSPPHPLWPKGPGLSDRCTRSAARSTLDQLRCFLGVLSGREVAREQLSQRVRVVLHADLRGRAVVLYEAIRMIMKIRIRTISGSARISAWRKIREDTMME